VPDARIYVKIDVDNAAAIAKIRATEASIASIIKKNDDLTKRVDALAKAHFTEVKALEQKGKQLDKHSKAVLNATKASHMLERAGGALMKVIKYGAMEFGAMTAVLGGLKVALLAGQYVMKGFHVGMLALGAAAGVAIGAISGVLGAIRELQTAKLSGDFKAVYGLTPPGSGPEATRYRSSRGLINRTMGDSRFGMISDAGLTMAMQQQLQHGQQVGGAFRNQFARLGDLTGGDEKKMLALNKAMAQGAEAGKITQSVYDALVKTSPALGKAFEEMTGGPKQAADAAAKGSITFEQFNKVLMEGNLKALQPYNGALNEINNTVMGKFKGAVRSIKEQLTGISETSANALYGSGTNMSIMDAIKKPIDEILVSVKATINAITPLIQQMVPGLFGNAGDLTHHLTDSITTGIARGMEWMKGFSARVNSWIGTIRSFFGQVADYLTKASAPFDTLWKTILVPLGEFLAGTLNTAIQSFGNNVTANASSIATWGDALKGAVAFTKAFFEGLSTLKAVMTPIITLFANVLKPIEALVNTKIGGFFAKFAVVFGALFMLLRKVVSGFVKWKASMAEAFGTMKKTESEYAAITASVERLTAALRENLIVQRQMTMQTPNGGFRDPNTGRFISSTQARRIAEGQVGGGTGQPSVLPSGAPAGGTGGSAPATEGTGSASIYHQGGVSGWWARRKAAFGYGNTGYTRYLSGTTPMSRREMRADAWENLSDEEQFNRVQQNRAKMAGAAAMTAMVAGGMLAQSKSKQAQFAGNAISGIGMGAMIGNMLPEGKMSGAAVGAGAMGAVLGGQAIMQQNKAGMAQGVLGGALMGAGTGAMVGSFFGGPGGPGTFIGAGIGAVAGGIYGGVQAHNKKIKDARDAERAAASRYADQSLNTIDALKEAQASNKKAKKDVADAGKRLNELGRDSSTFHKGGSGLIGKIEQKAENAEGDKKKRLQRQLAELRQERSDLQQWATNYEEQVAGYEKATKQLNKAGKRIISNIKVGEFFGFNASDIAGYADRHNIKLNKIQLGVKAMVDMTGYSMKAADAMSNLALSAKRTYEWLTDTYKAARESAQASIDSRKQVADFLATSNQPMDKDSRFLAGTDAMTSLASQGTAFLAAGGYGRGKDAFTKFRTDQTAKIYRLIQEVSARPGVQTDMVQMMQMLGGEAINKINSGFKFSDAAQMDPSISENLKGLATGAATSIIQQGKNAQASGKSKKELVDLQQAGIKERALAMAQWAKNEYHLSDNVNDLAAEMSKLIGGTIQEEGGTLYDKTVQSFATGGALAAQQMTNAFTAMRLVADADGKGFHWEKGKGQVGTNLTKEQQRLVASGTQSYGAETQITPDLLNSYGITGNGDLNGDGIPGDTSSSRFARTLVAHSMFNSMVPGRRLMTSGLRNYNLGSLSSDHRIGAAYDLTGDNLGAYAKLVNANGGFAEFHGAAGSRHLHVVPPHGDSASPAMVGGYGAVHNHSYSIVVNGGDASAAAIADEVLARIQRIQRNAVERY
jgi:hypothetical protein